MLLLGADEVARNGAFGKLLRPEVFPSAPLQSPFVAKARSAQFPGPPPRVLLEVRISRETGGVPLDPFPSLARKLSGQNKLIPHIDAGLAQQLGDRVAL